MCELILYLTWITRSGFSEVIGRLLRKCPMILTT